MIQPELLEYFQSDKSDWYVLEGSRKIWDKQKVKEFWQKIRENKQYGFYKYNFPVFEGVNSSPTEDNSPLTSDKDFWKKGQKKTFENYVSFNNSKFFGEVDFSGVKFNGGADFIGTEFFDTCIIKRAFFKSHTWFGFAKFYENTYFQAITFDGYTDFYENVFKKNLTLENSIYQGKVDFNKIEFNSPVNLKNLTFLDDCNVLFQDLIETSHLKFENVIFSENVIFRRLNLSNFSFKESDITKLNIRDCSWNNGNRIIINDEIQGDLTYHDLGGLYRQIKRNYEINKDWEFAGKAYRSEMLMRRYALYSNKKFGEWVFYWIYGRFSGFTQSILTPFFLLIVCILIFPLAYFSIEVIDLMQSWNCNFIESFNMVRFEPYLKNSLTNTIPIIKNSSTGNNWWSDLTQKIISSILLVFFVLALRKRFKQ